MVEHCCQDSPFWAYLTERCQIKMAVEEDTFASHRKVTRDILKTIEYPINPVWLKDWCNGWFCRLAKFSEGKLVTFCFFVEVVTIGGGGFRNFDLIATCCLT